MAAFGRDVLLSGSARQRMTRAAPANKPPCDHNHVVTAMSQEADAEIDAEFQRRYQSLVGALLYCSGNTRPDVAFAVGMLCRAMSKPTKELCSKTASECSRTYTARGTSGFATKRTRSISRVRATPTGASATPPPDLLSGSNLLGIEEAGQRGTVVLRSRDHGRVRSGKGGSLPCAH